LQQENKRLRNLVKEHIPSPTEAQNIFKQCCVTHPLYKQNNKIIGDVTSSSDNTAASDLVYSWSDYSMIENLIKTQQSFVITDPNKADNPIEYISPAFLELTGYTKEEVIGRNCRFLQGIGTDPAAIAKIRENIEQGKDTSVTLLNYKADGTPFWNQFFIAALRDKEKKIINYVSFILLYDHTTKRAFAIFIY
jgi:PAS domain S-box-containing protein